MSLVKVLSKQMLSNPHTTLLALQRSLRCYTTLEHAAPYTKALETVLNVRDLYHLVLQYIYLFRYYGALLITPLYGLKTFHRNMVDDQTHAVKNHTEVR